MTERRPRDFSKDAKIAQLLCMVFGIPHEHQKLMREDQVSSLFDWHHNSYYADGGSNHFSNAVPMFRAAHKERTAKIDVPAIAKGKRIRNKEAVRLHNIMAKSDPEAAAALYPSVARLKRRKAKIANRPFPQQHRPLQSRGFQRRRQ